jgi:hypothetical protein
MVVVDGDVGVEEAEGEDEGRKMDYTRRCNRDRGTQ